MKKFILIFICLIIWNRVKSQYSFGNQFLSTGYTSGEYHFQAPVNITSPETNLTTTINTNANITYKAGHSIKLQPGFNAGLFNPATGSKFHAKIEPLGYELAWLEPENSAGTVGKFEKVEIGVKLPNEIQNRVDLFYKWNRQSVFGMNNWVASHGIFVPPLPPNAINPFDPEQLSVEMHLTSPTGLQYTRFGFYYREFERTPINSGPQLTTQNPLPDTYPVPYIQGYDETYTDYVERPTDLDFRFRVSFNEIGIWSYTVKILNNGVQVGGVWNDKISVISSDNLGFIQTNNNNNRYWKYQDGGTFFPIGVNFEGLKGQFDWRGTEFIAKLEDLANGGGNFFELWMHSNMYSIERELLNNYDTDFWYTPSDENGDWIPDCQGNWQEPNYCTNSAKMNRQIIAWLIDGIVDKSNELGLKMQLALCQSGQLTARCDQGQDEFCREEISPGVYNNNDERWDNNDWGHCPYNNQSEIYLTYPNLCPPGFDCSHPPQSNPCDMSTYTLPNEYYYKPEIQPYIKKMIRYVSSRWGYSTTIASYELSQETNNAHCNGGLPMLNNNENKIRLRNWGEDIGGYIKDELKDSHLLSFSCLLPLSNLNDNDDQIKTKEELEYENHPFSSTKIDFGDFSTYNYGLIGSNFYQKKVNNFRNIINKPYLIGETQNVAVKPGYNLNDGCSITGFHNVIWGSVFSGTLGVGLEWWWEFLYWKKKTFYEIESNQVYGNNPFESIKPLRKFIDDNITFFDNYNLTSFSGHSGNEINTIEWNYLKNGSDQMLGWVHNKTYYPVRDKENCDYVEGVGNQEDKFVDILNPEIIIEANHGWLQRWWYKFYNTWNESANSIEEHTGSRINLFATNLHIPISIIHAQVNDFNPQRYPNQRDWLNYPDYAFKVWREDHDFRLEESMINYFTDTLNCYKDSIVVGEYFNNDINNNFNYLWKINGIFLSNMKNPIIKFKTPDKYLIEVDIYNSNDTNKIKILLLVKDCNNVKNLTFENNSKSVFSIFPNPGSKSINLYTEQSMEGYYKYYIYSSTGQLISSRSLKSNLTTLNIEELSEGLYNLIITKNNELLFSNNFIKNDN